MGNHNSFLPCLIDEILLNATNDFNDNYDYIRFGNKKIKFKVKELIFRLACKYGFIYLKKINKSFETILPNIYNFKMLYSKLYDEESKELLIKLLTYRCLGYRQVKLPLNNYNYWNNIKKIKSIVKKSDFLKINLLHFKIYKIYLDTFNYPTIQGYFMIGGVNNSFVLEQYKGRTENKIIQVEEGDYVIDAGACHGDASLYFAYKVGKKGKVFCVEFIPHNIEIFTKNISLNPMINENIQLIKNPLWDVDNTLVYYIDKGPASNVSFDCFESMSGKTSTITIDTIVEKYKIQKIDFIKMDIEGAELNALKGSINTLLNYKPKLALSIYHNLSDFYLIPEFLDSLNIGYKYFIRHFTIHAEETILFAWVDK